MLRSLQLDATTKYELLDKHGEHDHFICNNCQKVSAIFIDEKAIKSQLPKGKGFSVTVRGVCGQCC